MQLSSVPDFEVQIERGRSTLRVIAIARAAGPPVLIEVTFSGGPDGVSFRCTQAEGTRVFSRDVVARHPPVSALLRLIADEVDLAKRPSEALLGMLFRALFVYLSRMSTMVPFPHWGRPVRNRHIERALELLHSDPSKLWTVDLLARAVGLSRSAFAQQFVRVMQRSPMRYLTNRRMQVAAYLLHHSDATLAEIAASVGYQSEFAFSRAFKRHHGVSPNIYRRSPPVAHAMALRAAA